MERTRQQVLSKNQDRFLGALLKRLGTERFARASADQLMSAVGELGETDDTDMVMMYLRGAPLTRIGEVYGAKTTQVSNAISRVADAIAASEVTVSIEHDIRPEPELDAAPVTVQQAIGEVAVRPAQQDNYMPCRIAPDLFFSDRADDVERAKQICGRCTEQAACLEKGIEYDLRSSSTGRKDNGIWGGLTVDERRKLIRRRMRRGV